MSTDDATAATAAYARAPARQRWSPRTHIGSAVRGVRHNRQKACPRRVGVAGGALGVNQGSHP